MRSIGCTGWRWGRLARKPPAMLLERYLESLGSEAIAKALKLDGPRPALVRATQDPKFGDFQINGAMPLGKELKKPPRELGRGRCDREGRGRWAWLRQYSSRALLDRIEAHRGAARCGA
ncbi:MAG: hypothetical protein JRJ24_07945 [Deltaproteobacteria bacterium]|nr:hypothetical protein [Deltaproteobacteria bacterium]